MSNRERAAQIISDHGKDTICNEPECLAQDLDDAGLLAPDLPEPSRGMFPRGAAWYLTGQIGDIRRTEEGIVAFGRDCHSQPFRLVLTEAEAEAIAHAFLAATNYAEGADTK